MMRLPFKFDGIHIVSRKATALFSLGLASAITLFPFVFYKTKYHRMNYITKAHESIHIYQQMECAMAGVVLALIFILVFNLKGWFLLPGILLFYILYGLNYLINLIRCRNAGDAYRLIVFEREAYFCGNIPYYTVTRNIFSWIRYIK